MHQQSTVYRASGKVLIAGGYGVLAQGNYGLSVAVKKHFYSLTSVEWSKVQGNQIQVKVNSPQINSTWEYTYFLNQKTISQKNNLQNAFVQNALKYTLQYGINLTNRSISKISLTILFDRGFLSESSQQPITKDKFFNYQGQPSKTGLGSSACVVVVVVGGIMNHLNSKCRQEEINVLSHAANTAAQNKIGSNFDISTAVFGSQLYTNVLPRKIFKAVSEQNLSDILSADPKIRRLDPNRCLTQSSTSWTLDLRKGSNTRTMVSGFVKNLEQQQIGIVEQFYNRSKQFVQQIYSLINSDRNQPDFKKSFKQFNKQYRHFLQKYSYITQIPVEPPEFKLLLDEISSIDDILYCLCPGSGGYDAIFIISLGSQIVKLIQNKIKDILQDHKVEGQLQRIDLQWKKSKITQQELFQIHKYKKK